MSTETRRCCFADALSARVAGCSKALKSTRQYRRTTCCTNGEAHALCAAWMNHLRTGSRFALGAQHTPSALPRGTAVKLQCGGLLGMRDLVEQQPSVRIRDVSILLKRAISRFGSLQDVPMEPVIRRVQAFDTDER
jgi:hypothetical protein